MIITIIMGSGVYTKGNDLYRGYIDKSIELAAQVRAGKIILCGGITNPHLPELSEAQSIKQYLLSVHPDWDNKILTDDTSLTSYQNLQNADAIIKEHNLTVDTVHICCDSIRAPKNFYCAGAIFNHTIKLHMTEEEIYTALVDELYNKKIKIRERITLSLKNLHVEGMPLERSIDDVADQIAASIIEAGFTEYPALQEKVIHYKKKIWGF